MIARQVTAVCIRGHCMLYAKLALYDVARNILQHVQPRLGRDELLAGVDLQP